MQRNSDALRQILDRAASEERFSLLEHEVYQFLQAAGCTVPRHLLLMPGQTPELTALQQLGSERVMVKVVSPDIAHKTDVGGVVAVDANPQAVRSAIDQMLHDVPRRFVQWLDQHPGLALEAYRGMSPEQIEASVRQSIRGFLVVQRLALQGHGPGSELLVGLRHNREFGPVLTLGVGGVDTELFGEACRKGQSVVTGSALLLAPEQLLALMRPTLAYKRLAGLTRQRQVLVSDDKITTILSAFTTIAKRFGSDGPQDPEQPWTVTELEVNPFAPCDGQLIVLDGLLKFRARKEIPSARPLSSLGALLHPKSMGLIGVSTKGMNMGRIILRNVIEAGFDPKRTYVVRPDADQVDGVRCVPTIADLPERVDVFVLAIGAEQVPETIEQLAKHDKAVGVILIAGGMGEKEGGASLEDRVKTALREARDEGKPLVINGGNSLGVVSRPGHYHTLFIPQTKLPLRQDGRSNVAFLSQSGAYMISRMSKMDWMSPRYAVSTGNQIDVTVADYLFYLAEDPTLNTFAVYVEGFKDGDGVHFAKAVQKVTSLGKDVIFYKAGRTAEGKSATSGHTASLAGEYDVCASIAKEAGAYVANSFEEFLDLVKVSSWLGQKTWSGPALAAMSNAGYEAVGIADSVRGEGWDLKLAKFLPETKTRLADALKKAKLDSLVDVRNPLDVTPMANDAAHEDVIRAFLDDPNVDLVLCACVPLTPAVASLGQGVPEEQSIRAEGSVVSRLGRIQAEAKKPMVACIDSGILYDAMARALEEKGIPTFRSADNAVRSLGLYLAGRKSR